MSRRLYSHNRVKYWYCYDIDEICNLFSSHKLHHQTVRAWLKKGLKKIDSGKPILVYGNDLIKFLKDQNTKNKCSLRFLEFYCMKCRDARTAYRKKVLLEKKGNLLRAKCHCPKCKTLMNKSYKLSVLGVLRRKFRVVDVLELYDCKSRTDKTHLALQNEKASNESLQTCLF